MAFQILQPLFLLFVSLLSSNVLATPPRRPSIGFSNAQIALFGPSTANAVPPIFAHDDWGPVPGISPVRFNQDPDTFLFMIEELDMHPNPCVMYFPLSLISKLFSLEYASRFLLMAFPVNPTVASSSKGHSSVTSAMRTSPSILRRIYPMIGREACKSKTHSRGGPTLCRMVSDKKYPRKAMQR